MANPKIFPVIHYLDRETAFAEVGTAVLCGADGVFLISHHGNDEELLDVGVAIKEKHPGFPIGINLLSTGALEAARSATALAFPMFWGDDLGVDSSGAYFSPSWTAFQADRGRDFSVIVDGISN